MLKEMVRVNTGLLLRLTVYYDHAGEWLTEKAS